MLAFGEDVQVRAREGLPSAHSVWRGGGCGWDAGGGCGVMVEYKNGAVGGLVL